MAVEIDRGVGVGLDTGPVMLKMLMHETWRSLSYYFCAEFEISIQFSSCAEILQRIFCDQF